MKNLIIFLLILINSQILTPKTPPSEALNFIKQDFDVLKYDLKLDLQNYPGRKCIGENTIIFTMSVIGDFYFHLKSLSVDSVKLNGEISSALYNVEDDYYSVFVLNPLDTNILKVYYSGDMNSEDNQFKWGGVSSLSNNLFSMGVGFGADYVSCARHFMPCYDHPSDKAEFEAEFIVPKGITVASNGLLEYKKEEESSDVFKWIQTVPSATYLLNFAAARYERYEFESTPHTVVYGSKFEKNPIETIFPTVKIMVENFESYFGKYPFEKVGYVLTPIGSMEHASLISISANVIGQYYAMKDVPYTVVAHELAHQWFGNSVTPLDFRDAWLSEGFATYCEALYHQYLLGEDAFISKIESDAKIYMNSISKNEGILSLYDFNRIPPSSNYPATIYNKGAVVLYMLMNYLGEDRFYEAVKFYLNEFGNGNASTYDFQKAIESSSGEKLDYFFNQWVYGKGYPIIEVNFKYCDEYNGNSLCIEEIIFEQIQDESYGIYSNLPVKFQFVDENEDYFSLEIIVNDVVTNFKLDKPIEFRAISKINNDNHFKSLARIILPQLPVSVEKINNPIDISISPNPTSENVIIKNLNPKVDIIAIYDIKGREIMRQKIEYYVDILEINTKSLQSGTYILQVISEEGIFEKKFIINR